MSSVPILGAPSDQERAVLYSKIMDVIRGDDSTILVAESPGKLVRLAEIYLKRPEAGSQGVVSKIYAHL
jgi:hypothetical protein